MAAPASTLSARSEVYPLACALVAPFSEPLPLTGNSLSFSRYSAGTDALVDSFTSGWGTDCVLELSHELAAIFENEYSVDLIQRGLFALQPRVELHSIPATRTQAARTDVPALSDENVDALGEWCEQQVRPHQPSLLTQLLEKALS